MNIQHQRRKGGFGKHNIQIHIRPEMVNIGDHQTDTKLNSKYLWAVKNKVFTPFDSSISTYGYSSLYVPCTTLERPLYIPITGTSM